jgi:hypothetical protein
MTQAMTEYISCTKCHALYLRSLGSAIPARCNNKPDFSPVCNEPLFKIKEGSNLRGPPFKIYPANSIIKSIQQMMQRPDFEEKIERWRTRSTDSNQRGDISDGTMWHEIKDSQGNKFCSKKRSLFFTLNVDWLDIFSGKNHGHHSTGAMFLSCDSLPREERLKPGNIINLGVIPGPKEPNFEQIYNYLDLAIDEFSSLYNGVKFTTFESPDCPVVVRAALLKIASDSPAARRIAGFLSHSSYHPCFICDAIFRAGNRKEGFDIGDFSEQPKRTKESNKNWAEKWRECESKTEREQVEREGGTRWSPFHRLSYFDPIK